jgi:hypothetical protein
VHAFTVRYSFQQRFQVTPRRAFAWCTDYRSDDHALIGAKGRRKISKISDGVLLVTDTWPRPHGGWVTKVKLVRLEPKKLSWVSTHVSGPARHSQFLYRVVPEGRGSSRLEVSGVQIERSRNRPTHAVMNSLSRRLCKEDSEAWKLFARAMEAELAR